MTIQRRIILFFAVVILLLLSIILLMWYRLNLQKRLTRAEKSRYDSYRVAVHLKGTSDHLTRMIRTYTLTANPHYREFYEHILNIRKGKEPRPVDYDLLYWDLVDFNQDYQEPEGVAIPLHAILKQINVQPAELAVLREAKQYADQLALIEKDALHLMDLASINDDLSNANRLAAQQILHDARYNRIRRRMMEKLKKFFTMIDRRTSANVEMIRQENQRIDWVILLLITLLLLIALISWIHSRRKIVHPLQELIRWTDRLKDGHFRISNTIQGQDEIAQLAKSFTTMAETIHQNLDELNSMAHTDRLTGLPNRTLLEVELERLYLAARFFDLQCGLILIDLDHFKEVNDRYGHDVGDRILKRFADFLRENIDKPHVVGRWGGEEFLILTRNLSFDQSVTLAEKLKRILAFWEFPYERHYVTASWGVACLCPDETISQALKHADMALYRAKKNGRNRVEAEEGDRRD